MRKQVHYSIQAIDESRKWRFYGQRNTRADARLRAKELRQIWPNVRIVKHTQKAEVIT